MTVKENLQPLFGRIVVRLREGLGLSRRDLAEALGGLSVQYVGSLEQGRREPGLNALVLFARALGVPAPDLLSDALEEAQAGWWDRVLDGLDSPEGESPDYCSGYDDALIDASSALSAYRSSVAHVRARSPEDKEESS